jgi:hypothetical protein
MTSWSYLAERTGGTVLWSCIVPGCGGGNFISDAPGVAGHQAVYGHQPVAGRPLCPVMGVGT